MSATAVAGAAVFWKMFLEPVIGSVLVGILITVWAGVAAIVGTIIYMVRREGGFRMAYIGDPRNRHALEHKAEVISITRKAPAAIESAEAYGNKVVGHSQLLKLDPSEVIEK
jgi:hypothetical protein